MTKLDRNRPSTPNPIITEEEEKRALELFGDLKEMEESMKQFRRDRIAMSRLLNELVVKHPDRWFVFVDGKPVGYGKDLKRLYKRLTKKGIDLSRAMPKFLTTKRRWRLLKVA